MQLRIPDFGLVVLIGASGAGKSTLAAKHLRASEVLASDHYRSVVGDDDRGPETTRDAFAIIETIAERRLARRRLTVIDATNVRPDDRKRYMHLARRTHAPLTAILLDLPENACHRHNAGRDEPHPRHVVHRQAQAMRQHVKTLSREGFRRRHRIRTADEARTAEVRREPLASDERARPERFDVIGDVHGCRAELEALLRKLGYRIAAERRDGDTGYAVTAPEGRTAVFVGDLVDRGPDGPGTLRLVMDAVDAGAALVVPGNHDSKLARALEGRDVRRKHGLAETMSPPEKTPEAFRERVRAFLGKLPSHVVLDGGRLVVAHAGMPERLQNRTSREVREFGLYGETTGETDDEGLPVRIDWAQDYRGAAAVVYGHTPVAAAEWTNNTICIDTECAYGGWLSALRWPEREVVSVEAQATYETPPTALTEARTKSRQQESDRLLSMDDIGTPMRIQTALAGTVAIRRDQGAAAIEAMGRLGGPAMADLPAAVRPATYCYISRWTADNSLPLPPTRGRASCRLGAASPCGAAKPLAGDQSPSRDMWSEQWLATDQRDPGYERRSVCVECRLRKAFLGGPRSDGRAPGT